MMDKCDGILKNDAKKTIKADGSTANAKVLYDVEIARKILDGMTKEQFHKKVIKGVAMNPAFGALVSFGAKNMSSHDKITVRTELAKIAIPYEMTKNDASLDEIANYIATRSVKLV